VQRFLKFSKYLRSFGWEPVIYTVENGQFQVIDHSFEKDIPPNLTVLKQPIREPYEFYKLFVGQNRGEKTNSVFISNKKKSSVTQKIAFWIRGNFFIPDARMFWIKPSVKFLNEYLSKSNVDAIVSTGPPHSVHIIAMRLRQKLNIPWLADFRDPWTKMYYYPDLMLTKWADKKHHRLEKEVLSNADAITVIGETMKQEFSEIVNREMEVITNGYDEDDVYSPGEIVMDKRFSMAYIGTLLEDTRPFILWQALSELVNENKQFAADLDIKLIGKIDVNIIESIKKSNLANYFSRVEYVPHKEVSKIQQQSQVLLMKVYDSSASKGIITGKLFEYLTAKRPVLFIGPEDGDAAKIIEETGTGVINNYTDVTSLKQKILLLYSQYKAGTLRVNPKGVEQYSRKNLTGKLAEVLNKISSK
jgi:hypothetical protein